MRKKAAGRFSTCDSPFLSFWSFNVSFTFLSFFGSIINVVFANTIISEVYVPCFISSLLHFYCKFVPEKKSDVMYFIAYMPKMEEHFISYIMSFV